MLTFLIMYRAFCTVYYPHQPMHNVLHLLIWIINSNVNLFSGRPSHLSREWALTFQKTWTFNIQFHHLFLSVVISDGVQNNGPKMAADATVIRYSVISVTLVGGNMMW